MSFLRVFKTIFHGIEAGAKIAAPIISVVNPVIGGLLAQGVNTAILAESSFTSVEKGDDKAKFVADSSRATMELINSILASVGKPPLPAAYLDAVLAGTKSVVDTMNVVADTVERAPGASSAVAGGTL